MKHTAPKRQYSTGEAVPVSGIYNVVHSEHRVPHEVILISGDRFPRCSKCDRLVKFELLREARAGFQYYPVRVYELPVLDDDDKQADTVEA